MNNKTTIESATAEIEERTGSYLQVSFNRAPKKNSDALAQLEKHFAQWRVFSPQIEDEVVSRMQHLAELSNEIEGRRLHHEQELEYSSSNRCLRNGWK